LLIARSVRTRLHAVLLDTDNKTVYSTWNDLQRSLKIIGNIILRQLAFSSYQRPEKARSVFIFRQKYSNDLER